MSHSEETSKKKSKKVIEDMMSDIDSEASLFLTEDQDQSDTFIPEVTEEQVAEVEESEILETSEAAAAELAGSELDGFESAQIEEVEFIEDERLESIIESILFASDRPVSLASIQMVFKGTSVKKDKIRRALDSLAVEYAGGRRGVTLEEITGGYQIRTKIDNMNFLKGTVKARPFKLSGPALETLAIVAYKQPVVKIEIDQIRGVESGHLMRALMEKGLVNFEGKAENLPGKPMQYGTTRKFLEIFGLRNLKELPTLSQIDELLPEGIGEEAEEKPTLSMVTDSMSEEVKTVSYSQGEEELGDIENQLTAISTSSEFFEQEKLRQKMKRDEEKAQNIRESMLVGEDVPKRDVNWLKKYEQELLAASQPAVTETTEGASLEASESAANETSDEGEQESSATSEIAWSADEDTEFLSEEAEHIEDEIPFLEEADEDSSEEGHV